MLPVLLVIYSMRLRFFQRICFQFCLLSILWGQGSPKGFASSSACYLFYEVKVLLRVCFQFCLLFILWCQGSSKGFASNSACYFFLWGQGSSKRFASISACYLFYEVKVLPKDLLPVLLVINSMRSRFFQRICFQFCFVIYSMRSRFFQRICFQFFLLFILMRSRFFQGIFFQFCLLFILWGQGSSITICFQFCLLFILWGQGYSKGFAFGSACYLFYEVKVLPKICFQFCLLFIIWGQGFSKGLVEISDLDWLVRWWIAGLVNPFLGHRRPGRLRTEVHVVEHRVGLHADTVVVVLGVPARSNPATIITWLLFSSQSFLVGKCMCD